MIRCKVCYDLPGRPCIACSKASRVAPTGDKVWCALCEAPNHVAKLCPKTKVGALRAAAVKRQRYCSGRERIARAG